MSECTKGHAVDVDFDDLGEHLTTGPSLEELHMRTLDDACDKHANRPPGVPMSASRELDATRRLLEASRKEEAKGAQRIAELRSRLKVMTEDRDDYKLHWENTTKPTPNLADGQAMLIEEQQRMLAQLRDQKSSLRSELKAMTKDRDEYQRRAHQQLKAEVSPDFFIVWNPHGPTPPQCIHLTHEEARDVACSMATKHPGEPFFVLAEAGRAEDQGAQWHCDQRHWDEEIPF